MIFAAGRGTRLQPLTSNRPKALVELNGLTLLQYQANRLRQVGITDLVVNVHHFAAMVKNHLNTAFFKDFNITISDESDQLLDTGGGLLKAAKWLSDSEPFLLVNVDIVTDIDLTNLVSAHQQRGSLATLATGNRPSSRVLLATDDGWLGGWANRSAGDEIIVRPGEALHPEAFCGIHVISPQIFPLLSKRGAFPIIPEYLALAPAHPIACQPVEPGYWFDVGKPDDLKAATGFLAKHNSLR